MDQQMEELESRWNDLEANWAKLDKCLGTAESLQRDAQRLTKWLEAKQQLLDAGSAVTAADVKLVDAQLNIVKVERA